MKGQRSENFIIIRIGSYLLTFPGAIAPATVANPKEDIRGYT